MQSLVTIQALLGSEAFPAGVAHVRPLTCVRPLVNDQISPGGKAFLAGTAWEGLFARVRSLVREEFVLASEGF